MPGLAELQDQHGKLTVNHWEETRGAHQSLWYVVHTRSRHEFRIEADLRAKHLEIFLPRLTVPSRRRDRKQLLEVPLFPGYLFIHADLDSPAYHDIIKHRGVVRILGVHGRYEPVPQETVAAVRTMVESGRPYYPWLSLSRGMRVRVVEGPLAGVCGTILRRREHKLRLVVEVELMQRAVAVELDEEILEPCP